MKKTISLTIVLNFTLFFCFAQQKNAFTKEVLTTTPETSLADKSIRNSHAVDLKIGNVIIEKRVAKYYAEGDLDGISEDKAKKINIIYLKSFEVINNNYLTKVCQNSVITKFDTSNYNHLRNKDSRKIINVIFEGCELQISLFSWDEIDSIK